MVSRPNTEARRKRRHKRVRSAISGTASRPRLNVYRSLNHIYAQIIDDVKGVTIVSASSLDKDIKEAGGNKKVARQVGTLLAERAKKAGVSTVIFDRGGYLYHGRVQELAEGARKGGLAF